MKNFLLLTVFAFAAFQADAQTVIVNPDGTHSILINNGGMFSTIVNPDGTHSTVINTAGPFTNIINPNGTQTTVINNGGNFSTVVNPDGTHSTLNIQGNSMMLVKPDGSVATAFMPCNNSAISSNASILSGSENTDMNAGTLSEQDSSGLRKMEELERQLLFAIVYFLTGSQQQ